ncbi:MAG: hypothetical protein QF812_03020 [Nitrososphaerales archaeon]|jgi:hypothetical protein|nr:hypothetical protein [Nitrososphaerales archaeon]|tara:strand:+ start:604 stop:804 length:201 start_codon:yes stop_codon:yes gene_type:complete
MKRTLTSDESLDLVLETAGNDRKVKDQNENFRGVKMNELKDYLNNNLGWKPKQSINSDKFLIERTS